MNYKLEGSNGGYPIGYDELDFRCLYESHYRKCPICYGKINEEVMVETTEGWMCNDCYNYLLENGDTKPKLK